jgi:peptidoglycan-N-acetylglucosamine deacetylase
MKKLILTFDDGPDLRYTGKLLDLLKQEQVRASFFVVAKNAEKSPELIMRMKNEGHTVALHSFEHRHAYLSGYHYMKKDFKKSMEILKKLGCNIHFYRPPWGARNLYTNKFVKQYQLRMVLWDVMAEDWKAKSTPQMIAGKIENRVFDGAVICLHDAGENSGGAKDAPIHTIEGLRLVIPKLKKAGYEFLTLEEFLKNE